MEERYLDKKIVFENGKLYCNGQEISIEEAEEIIRKQVKELEKSKEKLIQEADNLDEDRTRAICNELNETFVYASKSGIHVRGNNEYYETADLILQANLICDRALRLFTPEYRREKKLKEREKDSFKEIIENFDWEGINPTNIDIIEKSMEMYIISVVVKEIRKQFYNIHFNFKPDDIRVYLNLPFDIKIYIVTDNFTLFFQINQNIPKIYENIPFNFIVSSMRVNGFNIQNDFYDLFEDKSNNIKFAQTIENAIFKEIRFLKNLIKEEIDYSLSMNISRTKERFDLANKILEKYNGLLSQDLTMKVNQVIEETINYQNIEIKDETNVSIENNIDINYLIIEKFSNIFNIDSQKVLKEININNNNYEIIISAQKISLSILDNNNVGIKSINILNQGKNDIIKENIQGKNLSNKIEKAISYAYLPIIYRNIDNFIKSNKIVENRRNLKDLDDKLKDLIRLIYEDFNIYENIDFIQEKINDILDLINILGKNINREIFNILDFIFLKILENLPVKDIDINKFRNKISTSYKEFFELNNDFFETIIELKNLVKRILNVILLSIELNLYLNNIFDTSIESIVKDIANILAEDYICGKLCRNLLSLLDISDTLKDDTFKFQIRNIMLEFINIIY
ncbi:MAG: hypothetical protein KatS3mg068_1995 [Candidatus Sericytochromatia bacterium]|nr:MAG: hypothetical protein KatS3mg068_1995 [Candidatus Sericytochromatia bacterium]